MSNHHLSLPIHLKLFGTTGCHLCDDAAEQVQPFVDAQICQLESVDIVSDLTLYERYELHIPVLYNPHADDELRWPFTGPEVQQWLQQYLAQGQGSQ
jgi:hypothetical protein